MITTGTEGRAPTLEAGKLESETLVCHLPLEQVSRAEGAPRPLGWSREVLAVVVESLLPC